MISVLFWFQIKSCICTNTENVQAGLIGWWTAGVVIKEHPAESGLQDKDILTGHFSA